MTRTRTTTAPGPSPFLKWVGGKQASTEALIARFPRAFHRLIEPFAGGASVAFALARPGTVLCDLNLWLMETYRTIRENWRAVAAILDTLENSRDEYLRIRAIDPAELELSRRAAHFIYLNKTGFRGLFRVNKEGRFNVPYGAYTQRYYDPANLEACARVLDGFHLLMGRYTEALVVVEKGDFVYFDPPYYKLGGHADFNRYTSGQFREGDHETLARTCRELHERGIRWAVSNSDTPFVRELYRDFHIAELSGRREINLMSGRRDVSELLITNYGAPS